MQIMDQVEARARYTLSSLPERWLAFSKTRPGVVVNLLALFFALVFGVALATDRSGQVTPGGRLHWRHPRDRPRLGRGMGRRHRSRTPMGRAHAANHTPVRTPVGRQRGWPDAPSRQERTVLAGPR